MTKPDYEPDPQRARPNYDLLIRHKPAIFRRLQALYMAIEDRSWVDTEFAYDQVSRAIEKLYREAEAT